MPITTETLTPAIQASYDRTLLSTPTRRFIHSLCAERYSMPARGGEILRFQRFNNLPAAKVPLGKDGATPPASDLTSVFVDATIRFYGSWIGINEQVTLQSQCPVLTAAAIRLGVQFRTTEDELIRDMLAASAGRIDAQAGINGDAPTEITGSDIFAVTTQLQTNDALPISASRDGEDKFGTAPTFDAFFAYTHMELIADLHAINGFIPKANYPSSSDTLQSEVGTYGYARFVGSSGGAKTPNASYLGNAVYDTIILGIESYGIIDQDTYRPQFIYRNAMYSDPLAQNCTVSWKTAFATRILNDQLVLRLRSTRST